MVNAFTKVRKEKKNKVLKNLVCTTFSMMKMDGLIDVNLDVIENLKIDQQVLDTNKIGMIKIS